MLCGMVHVPTRSLSRTADEHVGLVLSGGGARGAFQVGVWEVLRNDRRGLGGPPAVISGTSAGALNGALIAAGRTPREMLDFWVSLSDRPPIKANRAMFASLEGVLARLALREPMRALHRRARAARIVAQLLRKHSFIRRGSRVAALVEYVLTARFDQVSEALDRIPTSYLFSTQPMRQRIVDMLGGPPRKPTQVRLAVNTVDVRTGDVIRFVNHAPHMHSESDDSHYRVGPITSDMVLASASIPLLFEPVAIHGFELWDGGLLVNTPLAPAVSLGATHIVPVLVTAGRDSTPERPLTLGTAVERLADSFLENAYNTDRKLLLERNRVARKLPKLGYTVVELYEAIRPDSSSLFNAGSYLYFEKRALTRMYEAGRGAARAWLDRGPQLDTKPGHPLTLDLRPELRSAEK